MSTNILLRIILFPILVFSSIVCKKNTNPIEVENESPIIVSDSWSLLPNPPGNPIWSMSVSTDGIFYAGTDGLVRSIDDGLSWEQIYSSGTPNVIYVSPYDGMIILSLSGPFRTTTIYSTDNGVTWEQSNEQPKSSSIGNYLSLPSGEILAGGWVHDESTGGIFISKDKGVGWKRVPDFVKEPNVVAFALNSANEVYAVIASGFLVYNTTAIYCSKDKGESWLQIPTPDSLIILNLVINKSDALIFSTNKSIFISESNTDNWKSLYPFIHNGYIESLGLDSNDNLLATFFDREDEMIKVLLFSQLSNNWYSIEGLNLPTSENHISTLIGRDHHIYLATFGSGIYKTRLSIDSILKQNL